MCIGCYIWTSRHSYNLIIYRRASQYFSREDGNLGGQYKKARYVEYTDATFSVKKQRDDSEKHLGLLGPIIKASYNNKIKV